MDGVNGKRPWFRDENLTPMSVQNKPIQGWSIMLCRDHLAYFRKLLATMVENGEVTPDQEGDLLLFSYTLHRN